MKALLVTRRIETFELFGLTDQLPVADTKPQMEIAVHECKTHPSYGNGRGVYAAALSVYVSVHAQAVMSPLAENGQQTQDCIDALIRGRKALNCVHLAKLTAEQRHHIRQLFPSSIRQWEHALQSLCKGGLEMMEDTVRRQLRRSPLR